MNKVDVMRLPNHVADIGGILTVKIQQMPDFSGMTTKKLKQ